MNIGYCGKKIFEKNKKTVDKEIGNEYTIVEQLKNRSSKGG